MTSSACTTTPSSLAFSASRALSRSATSPTSTLRRYFGHHTRWNLSENTAPALRLRGGRSVLYQPCASKVVVTVEVACERLRARSARRHSSASQSRQPPALSVDRTPLTIRHTPHR